MDLTLALRTCRLFADLDTRELAAIAAIAHRKELAKGQILFREGDPSRGFFLILGGAVKIYRLTPDGRERVFHVVEAGESFAEAALFMDTYPATAEALVPTTVVGVNREPFRQQLAHDPKLSFKIMGALVKWLAQLRDTLTDITTKEVPARFASYLLSLPARPAQTIPVTISKTTLAQMLGTTKETFSRMLARFARRRILTFRGREVKIHDRPRLQRIASGEEKL
jgi:CRP/FNR family transcriptional regulator